MAALDDQTAEMVKDMAKDIAKDVYADAAKPIVKPTGELIGLVPRAVKAALSPLEKWVLQKEYNIAETKKLLEDKLKDVSPENIQPPEAHIAVPAIQYISYCMDNDELRDMYANLLANSMNKVVKNGVHPGFVEIIKQLSPDEAKLLRYLSIHPVVPTITLRRENKNHEGIDVVKNFSNIGELSGCENPFNVCMYFNNLVRLGVLKDFQGLSSLTQKSLYDPLKNHEYIIKRQNQVKKASDQYNNAQIEESYVSLTDYGVAFCNICITPNRIDTSPSNP